MLFLNSRHPPNRTNCQIEPKRQSVMGQKYICKLLFLNWIRGLIRRLSIAQKIGYGYSLVLGISVLGTTVGLVVGEYYQEQARTELNVADRQQYLLSNLENTIGVVRSHPQELAIVLEDPQGFDYETVKVVAAIDRVKSLLNEIEVFTKNHPDRLAIDSPELQRLIKDYEANTESYNQFVKSLWREISLTHLKSARNHEAYHELLKAITGQSAKTLSIQFDRLSERLNQIKKVAETQHLEANNQLEQARILRLQIIVTTTLVSVGMAVALALITSIAIARPIEAVTQVARAVVQEGNFDLRSSVMTEDAVGSLASSLNQLVQWVAEYTEELKLAHQTLEERVEERTKELTEILQDLKYTQAQLIQSEKMSSLGQMVAGIAHEINNPINFIYGNLEHANNSIQDLLKLIHLYRQQCPDATPAIQEQIEAMDLDFLQLDMPHLLYSLKIGSERIREIVLSLRKFSHLDEAQMKPADIHEGLENTLLILNHRIKCKINIIKFYDDLPWLDCYPAQLNQVFMNILANAIDALEEVNSLEPKTTKAFVPTISIQTKKKKAELILVKIWNNGLAIPVEIQSKIFDPFFTTKPVGKGTGMGLAICYQIVEKHRGKIEVTSAPGEGTEFAISLPIYQN
ncbi:MAG TPA: histidine kinase [Cyanobacteria bacterium UBA8803]|nr:histidine kinase [Cyanobacteria bacterium UBA9273]HBL60016.1 histidine kinase [Cyanobacteria bacterium UBA8803]